MKSPAAPTRALPLVDFLALVLEAHASGLSRLAVKFGIEFVVETLEEVDDGPDRPHPLSVPAEVFANENPGQLGYPPGAAYQRLEGTVKEFDLPEQLEFYIWTYPFYRSLIEGPFPLDRPIIDVHQIVQIAIDESKRWLRTLPLNATNLLAAENVIQVPWVQFRAQVLEKAGIRRLGAV